MRLDILAIILIILVGCATETAEQPLPTRVILPATETPLPTHTPVFGLETRVALLTVAPSATATYPPTKTPPPTATITNTPPVSPTLTNTSPPDSTPVPPTNTPLPLATTVSPSALTGAVIAVNGANVRLGPGQHFEPPLRLLADETAVEVVGRTTDNSWYQIETDAGERGWVFGELLSVPGSAEVVPVTWVEIPTLTPDPAEQVVVIAPSTPVIGGPPVSQPPSAGVYYNIPARASQIFNQGRQTGQQPTVISTVGDSLTHQQAFLDGYDLGQYNLGPFGHLQPTIDYFRGSFARQSLAAFPGASVLSLMDPMYATDPRCQPDESPVACEYRINKPAISVILIGAGIDLQNLSIDVYRDYLGRIVDYTIQQNIIPVLTTFPNGPTYYVEKSQHLNIVVMEVAGQRQIPLIDLRATAILMDNGGVMWDGFHLSQRGDELGGDPWIDLNGDQNRYALTLRNFLTLQMLDSIRRMVMS